MYLSLLQQVFRLFVFLRAFAWLTALAFSFGTAAAPLERTWWVVGLRRLLMALASQ